MINKKTSGMHHKAENIKTNVSHNFTQCFLDFSQTLTRVMLGRLRYTPKPVLFICLAHEILSGKVLTKKLILRCDDVRWTFVYSKNKSKWYPLCGFFNNSVNECMPECEQNLFKSCWKAIHLLFSFTKY